MIRTAASSSPFFLFAEQTTTYYQIRLLRRGPKRGGMRRLHRWCWGDVPTPKAVQRRNMQHPSTSIPTFVVLPTKLALT